MPTVTGRIVNPAGATKPFEVFSVVMLEATAKNAANTSAFTPVKITTDSVGYFSFTAVSGRFILKFASNDSIRITVPLASGTYWVSDILTP